MSLYNLINGVNPAAFFVLPMLGKHPNEYPRFRDCFIGHEEYPQYDDHIMLYTRTGGGNRDDYQAENDEITEMPGYVTDFDDEFDSTFAWWVFEVPAKWAADFAKVKEGKLNEFSPEYRAELYRIFPKLKEKFDELFSTSANS